VNGPRTSSDRESIYGNIITLSVGLPARQVLSGTEIQTGICKRAIQGPVLLTTLGFEGDGVANTRYHGGPDKAVCVYCASHYPLWEEELGRALPRAAFGENLTICGFEEQQICVGDVLQLGQARVQVTQPRQPCRTPALRLECDDLVERIVHTGRCGYYLRVLKEGTVRAADRLVRAERDPHQVTVARAHRVRHLGEDGRDGLEQVLAVPALSTSWRRTLSETHRK
jgi:MOSC domain-containing protein YiiM